MTNESAPVRHTIADIERDTGLSKDTLRVWERRYGFPTPERDALGERQYDDAQLLRLRHIRRLLDAGHRPGQVVALPLESLLALSPCAPADAVASSDTAVPGPETSAPDAGGVRDAAGVAGDWLVLLRQHDAKGLRQAMERLMDTQGLMALLRDGVAPMNERVGQAWLAGQLAVFEEHLYSETVQAVLRHAMAREQAARPRQPPRVLLTTVPGEPHGLGLLMAECVMVLQGCDTVGLGVQTPLPDIVAAAEACRADAVALSFTAVQNPRDVRAALARLRELLPADVELWAGGRCPVLYRPTREKDAQGRPVFWPMAQLHDIEQGVARWRSQRADR